MARTIEIPPFAGTLTRDGVDVADAGEAREAMEHLFPGQEPFSVESDGAGLWLIDFPASVTIDVLFSGGWYEREADGFKVEVELP